MEEKKNVYLRDKNCEALLCFRNTVNAVNIGSNENAIFYFENQFIKWRHFEQISNFLLLGKKKTTSNSKYNVFYNRVKGGVNSLC